MQMSKNVNNDVSMNPPTDILFLIFPPCFSHYMNWFRKAWNGSGLKSVKKLSCEINLSLWLVVYWFHVMRKRKLSLARDASRYGGVGAVILHATAAEEYPIAFSSRKLKKSERNYLQIEETLAENSTSTCMNDCFTCIHIYTSLLSILGPVARMQRSQNATLGSNFTGLQLPSEISTI